MTIIAGFRCEDGIVLCADSQETIGTAKRSVPKLHYEPCEPVEGDEDHFSNLGVAFCGAGDGPFIDKLVHEAWSACKRERNIDDVCSVIEDSIKDTYREFGKIYQAGLCPEAQLIYGVKMDGKSKLFSAVGPLVNEKFEYDSGGVGHYMADFLASKLHCNWLGVRQAAILAAYILLEASEHVDSCGGDPQIVALRHTGASGTVSSTKLYDVTDLIRLTTWNAGRILLEVSDMDKDDAEVQAAIEKELELMHHSRGHLRYQQRLKYSDEYFNTIDCFGLPLKNEPQPKLGSGTEEEKK